MIPLVDLTAHSNAPAAVPGGGDAAWSGQEDAYRKQDQAVSPERGV